MHKPQLKNVLTDVRFWILVFFLIRLVGITSAPLEIGHNWRQSLTNMIARNFLENGANILYPTIDMAGEKTGIIGSEFPFLNYLIYLASVLFDQSHWYGRLINLLVSSLGLFYFYRLAKALLNRETAFNATIILSTSIWFAFSRKIMPDTFSVSLVIIGLYYGYSFLKDGYRPGLLLFFVLNTLGMLCKIPASALVSGLALVPFIKGIPTRRKTAIYTATFISGAVVYAWYFYWVPYLLKTYHYQLYFPKGLMEGIQEIIPLIPELLEKFYFSSLQSYVAFICCVAGLFLFLKGKHGLMRTGFGIITAVFFVFIIKTGAVFPLHNYYIIPFTPVMALLAGYAVSQIPMNYRYILLGIIAIEGIANQQHDFFIKESEAYRLDLERLTDEFIPKDDLIVINGGQSPQDIYFSHRKGWTIDNEKVKSRQYLDSLANMGAEYLIIDRSHMDAEYNQYQMLYTDRSYAIYKMTGSKPQ